VKQQQPSLFQQTCEKEKKHLKRIESLKKHGKFREIFAATCRIHSQKKHTDVATPLPTWARKRINFYVNYGY
jgi:hypothetical protein